MRFQLRLRRLFTHCFRYVFARNVLTRNILIAVLLCPLLFGCVDYDLNIRFDSQTHGEIVQTIHLSERLLAFTEGDRIPAFEQFSARAKAVSGKARRLDEDTLQVTIPFYNGAQLVERFNAFYDASSNFETAAGLPNVRSHLALTQQNYLLALRNHLTYDLQIDELQADLATPIRFNNRFNSPSPPSDNAWLNLDFHLTTPWGLVNESTGDAEPIQSADWHLEGNRPHHIEATFWVPSPVGIGAAAIALFCCVGYLLRYLILSDPQQPPASKLSP
ncbi:MAG: DUF3153 domain-containing protein [Cyanobacteria bacterium J06632_3]